MTYKHIFADRLLAFHYEDSETDEFERLFDSWQDPVFLQVFFIENEDDLKSGFFGSITIKDAILYTKQEAKRFENRIREFSTNNNKSLDHLFKPLSINGEKVKFEKSKAYGDRQDSWLRIYAIKIEPGCYIITGGAIKLTQRMDDRAHTKNELKKLKRCTDFLREQGVTDIEGFEIDL
ncbi:MAG: hypothetical protein ACKVOQ_13090 [Cyclobacteriaceae bacterium]